MPLIAYQYSMSDKASAIFSSPSFNGFSIIERNMKFISAFATTRI